MTDNQARFIARDMCAPDHEHCVDISPLLQVVTIGAAELEAFRQQAARVPELEAQVARLENDRRVRLAEIERIATKLRARRARSFVNCAAEFASMKRLYSMR